MQCTYYNGKNKCCGKKWWLRNKTIIEYCNGNYKECSLYSEILGDDLIEFVLNNINLDLKTRTNIINSIRNFRLTILEQNEECWELLMVYDRVSPLLVEAIWHSPKYKVAENFQYI